MRSANRPGCCDRYTVEDTIGTAGAIGRFFRGVFSFTGAKSSQEERVAAYLIREHDRGR